MRNSSLGPYDPDEFSPPQFIVVVNALFYASLGVILLAASIAMLIKSWVREFDRGLQALSIPEQRAKTREFRYLGMERWGLAYMVAGLPFLIQISLLLFAVGLVIFLFHINTVSFHVTTAIFGVGVLYYTTTTTISVFVTSSPFHSPLSRLLGKMYQYVHVYSCPGLDRFLSPKMDTTPVAPYHRLWRHIQIFLQKRRPYLETEFETPIGAATVDEFQLSITTSALQRILDSVPKSQHSELIHQSVWQVAGSPALCIQPLFKLPSWILNRGNDKEYFSRLSPASAVALTSVFVRARQARYKQRIAAVAGIDSEGHWPQLIRAIFDLLPNDDDYARLPPARLHNAVLRDAVLHDAFPDAPLVDDLRKDLLRRALCNDEPLRDDPLCDTFRVALNRRPVLAAGFAIISFLALGSSNPVPVVAALIGVFVLVLDMLGILLPLFRNTSRRPFVLLTCVGIIGVIAGTAIASSFFLDVLLVVLLVVLAVGMCVLAIGMLVAVRPLLHDTLRPPFVFFPFVFITSGAIVGSFFNDTFCYVVLSLSLFGLGLSMLDVLRRPFVFFVCVPIVGGPVIGNYFSGTYGNWAFPLVSVSLGFIGLIGLGLDMPAALRRPFFFITCVLFACGPFNGSLSVIVNIVIVVVLAVVVVVSTLGALLPLLRRALLCDETVLRDRGALCDGLCNGLCSGLCKGLYNALHDTLCDNSLSVRFDVPFFEALASVYAVLRDVLLGDSWFARFDTPFFEALVYVYALLRDALKDDSRQKTLRGALFCDPPILPSLRLFDAFLRLRDIRFDSMMVQGRIRRAYLEPEEPKHLISLLQRNPPQEGESIWLLNTLSWLHRDGLVLMKHHVSKICLAILLHQAPKWDQKTTPNIMLIESVVTLVAISCSSNEAYQMKILTNSHEHPWLLLNLRNPELISRMIENIHRSRDNEPISLLFLVLHALILRGSVTLAAQYLAIITAKVDFVLCASALTAIAPALGDDGLSAIGGLLLAPQTQFLTSDSDNVMSEIHQGLFMNYDLQLEASQLPDPNIFAILLLLAKNLDPLVGQQLQGTDLKLKNPWLEFAAKLIYWVDLTGKPGIDMRSICDSRLRNMLVALCLQRSLTSVSFLESRELSISSSALLSHLRNGISHSNLLPPSHYLPGAVHALFNPILPDNYLHKGWKILHEFMGGFEKLSVEWRQTFAEAFFTLSCLPLLSENRQNTTPVLELNEILTWGYFCKEEQEPEFTDRVFSGLDWMAMAWSLHISGMVSGQVTAQPPGLREPPENEEFVLEVLCRLLDATPYYSILPITPKLHEFIGWFDDTKFLDYQIKVIASIEGAKQEYDRCKKFEKFHCVLPLG